ncbi:hypothetical protein DEA8626_01574 [Defluviimonas aquaemixtae]|uniref:Uncharacterized protein n=1 Tax=Albidovulum aquaemixtae TaxID=1542388 RepID=A0A2R8B623_9RHOB|nr:hypothetical protein [Defluviimonas aquaemixtae]SPH18044.1 hypothetical protein DEA8626_01574 [Defluviimonas aquaemixtae]
MDMPKQMEAGTTERRQQTQQSQSETRERRKPDSQLADTPAEQMRPMHFSDWASI